MQRHRPWRRSVVAPLPETKTSHFDIWLSRVGAAAAIIVAVFATFGFFFTVVPIYKANLLEEQLSQKQIELARLQKLLDSTYAKVRDAMVHRYVVAVGAECTGLMRAPPESLDNDRKPAWLEILSIDLNSCFIKTAERNTSLAQLSHIDRTFFLGKLRDLVALIEKDRARSFSQAERLPLDARRDPSAVRDEGPGSYVKALTAALDLSPEAATQIYALGKIERAQDLIANEWAQRTRDRIDALIEIAFPPQ